MAKTSATKLGVRSSNSKPARSAKALAGAVSAKQAAEGDERRTSERRQDERRKDDVEVNVERRQLERREKVNRRRQIDPTTCERDYAPAEIEFMNALDEYKRSSGRMFPTCSEVLEVLLALGYRKTSPAGEIADLAPEAASDSPASLDDDADLLA